MPIYNYDCLRCDREEERSVPMAERNEQTCECGNPLSRKLIFTGSVFAPTAGGMR